MKNSKLVILSFVILSVMFLQGCSFGFNNDKKIINNTNNNATPKEKEIDYVKEISKQDESKNECYKYKERIDSEIEQYKSRVSKISDNEEKFNLIGIFKSKSLDKCFYVLENSYLNNGNKVVDYIINNAEIEETLDIFNNIDYKSLNERIKELQK